MLLDLPPEIRRYIFLELFRSVTMKCRWGYYHKLPILHVCRQIYNEAVPLVLPNVRVLCEGNADVIDTLTNMGPARYTQLRHLIVGHYPVGFKLFPGVEDPQSGATDGNLQEGHDADENSNAPSSCSSGVYNHDGVIYFHLGAILALFPGLQLDVLEVFCGVGAGPYTSYQTTDCFGSLLEADGYQRLWMEATGGDSEPWFDISSTREWKNSIMTKLKPHTGWIVRIKLPDYEWEDLHVTDLWIRAQNAGITLVEDLDVDSDDEDTQSEYGHESEDTADILVNRGDADFVVKSDDNRVLRCIERSNLGESPRFFKTASDALKKLFKENSWEFIKAMDGFDDGSVDDWNGGNIAYRKQLI